MSQPTQLDVERRRAIRIVHRDLEVMYDGVTDWVKVRSPDLTPEGLFLNTAREFRQGAHIRLRFELLRTGVFVQTMADVRYCLPGQEVGVEFVNLLPYARAAIEKELEELQKS